MTDLLARLAQRPPSREGYIDWELDRAEFDRDLALDALARAVQDEHSGRHYENECPICTALAPLLAERGQPSAGGGQ